MGWCRWLEAACRKSQARARRAILSPRHVRGAFLWVAVLTSLGAPRAVAQSAHHPMNFSFLYPLSTNRDPAVSTNFRLNILYGRVGAIRGVDLSGVYGRVDGPVRGVQVTGLVSTVSGELRGVSLTGLVQVGGASVRGLQISGLANFDRGSFRGIQYGAFFNFVEEEIRGAQITTLYNLANDDARWVQLSSVVNAVAGSFEGVQLSAGINYVQEDVKGLQAGLVGFAESFRGIQIGLATFTREAHGLQLGLVNYARNVDGHQFGLVNYSQTGGTDWVSFATNLVTFSTGIRTSLHGFYSMFSAGIGDLQDERGNTGSITWNYGYGFGLTPRWTLDADLGYVHLMPRGTDDPSKNGRLHYAVQARALGEYRWGPKTALFFGGGVSAVVSEYSMDASTEFEPLAVLGVSLY